MKKDRFDKVIEENYNNLHAATKDAAGMDSEKADDDVASDLLHSVLEEYYKKKIWLKFKNGARQVVLRYMRKAIRNRAIDQLRHRDIDILDQAFPLEQVDRECSYDIINALDQVLDLEKTLAGRRVIEL